MTPPPSSLSPHPTPRHHIVSPRLASAHLTSAAAGQHRVRYRLPAADRSGAPAEGWISAATADGRLAFREDGGRLRRSATA
jgi:hypothetical protein